MFATFFDLQEKRSLLISIIKERLIQVIKISCNLKKTKPE